MMSAPSGGYSLVPRFVANLPGYRPLYGAVLEAWVAVSRDYAATARRADILRRCQVSYPTYLSAMRWLEMSEVIAIEPDLSTPSRRRVLLLWRRGPDGVVRLAAPPRRYQGGLALVADDAPRCEFSGAGAGKLSGARSAQDFDRIRSKFLPVKPVSAHCKEDARADAPVRKDQKEEIETSLRIPFRNAGNSAPPDRPVSAPAKPNGPDADSVASKTDDPELTTLRSWLTGRDRTLVRLAAARLRALGEEVPVDPRPPAPAPPAEPTPDPEPIPDPQPAPETAPDPDPVAVPDPVEPDGRTTAPQPVGGVKIPTPAPPPPFSAAPLAAALGAVLGRVIPAPEATPPGAAPDAPLEERIRTATARDVSALGADLARVMGDTRPQTVDFLRSALGRVVEGRLGRDALIGAVREALRVRRDLRARMLSATLGALLREAMRGKGWSDPAGRPAPVDRGPPMS